MGKNQPGSLSNWLNDLMTHTCKLFLVLKFRLEIFFQADLM